MSKAVLISIRPEWCELIANGKKTIEVRKTKPKIETPFKCYIYCTACKSFYSIGCIRYGEDELYRIPNGKIKYGTSVELMGYDDDEYGPDNFLNRKVIGEFVCDEIMSGRNLGEGEFSLPWGEDEDCLSDDEIEAYGKNASNLYGWHISDLVIYDEPKELSEFKSWVEPFTWDFPEPITKAPQSWRYVEEVSE